MAQPLIVTMAKPKTTRTQIMHTTNRSRSEALRRRWCRAAVIRAEATAVGRLASCCGRRSALVAGGRN